MDVKEKLVELIDDMQRSGTGYFGSAIENKKIADYLIRHGVTVQDGKPLDAFLHPVDAYKGLKAKYLVFKADTGERVGNCFVLCPDKDPAAVEAIRAYARATDNETLAEDIYNWVGKGEPVQEWISVKDRLPEEKVNCIVHYKHAYCDNDDYWAIGFCFYDGEKFRIDLLYKVTHWMPLPQPPKGE